MPGQMGNARDPARPRGGRGRRRAKSVDREGRRARARGRARGGAQCLSCTAAQARADRAASKLPERDLLRALPQRRRLRGRARRAARAAPRHRRDADERRGPRRRREAVAPEGHRARPDRLDQGAALDGRRRRVRPDARAATPSRSTARRAGARCGRRSASTPSRGSVAVVDAAAFDAALDAGRRPRRSSGSTQAAGAGPARRRRGARARKSFRNIDARRGAAGTRGRGRGRGRRRARWSSRKPRSSSCGASRTSRRRASSEAAS